MCEMDILFNQFLNLLFYVKVFAKALKECCTARSLEVPSANTNANLGHLSGIGMYQTII